MQKISEWIPGKIKYVFCDIDDTITTDGQISAEAFKSLWDLSKAGIEVIPVTGRPAGWCEMIARMWPVSAVIGENGAFYFQYKNSKMEREFFVPKEQITKQVDQLNKIADRVLVEVPGSAYASDQFCRMVDVAIDFCEDVAALPEQDIQKIKTIFEREHCVAKISSIHVNAWFGDHDKLKMVKRFLETEKRCSLKVAQDVACFIGDSPNDEPMFAAFSNSVAVANFGKFKSQATHLPNFICSREAGHGFVEFSEHILGLSK
ncbi:MAG: HAD family hydrolase [Bdellovibrionales bacterium]